MNRLKDTLVPEVFLEIFFAKEIVGCEAVTTSHCRRFVAHCLLREKKFQEKPLGQG